MTRTKIHCKSNSIALKIACNVFRDLNRLSLSQTLFDYCITRAKAKKKTKKKRRKTPNNTNIIITNFSACLEFHWYDDVNFYHSPHHHSVILSHLILSRLCSFQVNAVNAIVSCGSGLSFSFFFSFIFSFLFCFSFVLFVVVVLVWFRFAG